MFKNEEMRQAM